MQKNSVENRTKCIILAYFQKHFKAPALIFRAFVRKIRIVLTRRESFEIPWKNSIEKLVFSTIFGIDFDKNPALGNNIISITILSASGGICYSKYLVYYFKMGMWTVVRVSQTCGPERESRGNWDGSSPGRRRNC